MGMYLIRLISVGSEINIGLPIFFHEIWKQLVIAACHIILFLSTYLCQKNESKYPCSQNLKANLAGSSLWALWKITYIMKTNEVWFEIYRVVLSLSYQNEFYSGFSKIWPENQVKMQNLMHDYVTNCEQSKTVLDSQ